MGSRARLRGDWMAFTGATVDEVAVARFVEKYGRKPAWRVVRDRGLVLVGPVGDVEVEGKASGQPRQGRLPGIE